MRSPVQNRALFVCLALVAGFSVLSARLIHLQWLDRGALKRKAEVERTHEETIPGWFGHIVDCNEEIMAQNLPVTTIVADKNHLFEPLVAARGVAYAKLTDTEDWIHGSNEERRRMLRQKQRQVSQEMTEGELLDAYISYFIPVTARALGIPSKQLEGKLSAEETWIPIVKDLREDEADEIEETLKENYIFGFHFLKGIKRFYTTPQLATHTTGFVNHEGEGQCGIERELAAHLRGRDGYKISRKDHTGLVLLQGGGKIMPPRPGLDVKLTLDLAIQSIVEEELDWGLQEFESGRGAVVMIEPKTGDVLAMASRPHFDLNLRENLGEENVSVNYATQAIYEPGSTFKVVATSAALDLGLMTPKSEVFCHWGYLDMGSYSVPDHHPYGMLSLEQVLAKSSNIGAFKIAQQVQPTRFMQYLKAFGFVEKTGIMLPDEQRGMITDHANPVNFSRMTYGYGVAVTPLQVACAYAAIANDGMRMKPRLVQTMFAGNGTVVKEHPPEEAQRVVSVATARKMRDALAAVMGPNATGRRGNVPGFRTGGKTGTARKIEKGRYVEDRYWVSFVGMLPIDEPAFVCVVVIDDPRTDKVKIGGGTVAAPIWKRIAQRTAAHLNLTPTEPIEEEEASEEALAAAGR